MLSELLSIIDKPVNVLFMILFSIIIFRLEFSLSLAV
jgi:hypothetical protein